MVHSEERVALAGLIQEFLDEQVKSFEFDERLDAFFDSTDPVVRHVAGTCWYFFDDFEDHLISVNKPGWDYLQRLLLLLKSNCVLQDRAWWVWSWTQIPAIAGVIGFALTAPQVGWGPELLLLAMPFGMLSVLLSHARPPETNDASPLYGVMMPFATFSDLAEAYHSAGFQKSRIPRHLMKSRIRSPFPEVLLRIQLIVIWLISGPLVLAIQGLPSRRSQTVARCCSS